MYEKYIAKFLEEIDEARKNEKSLMNKTKKVCKTEQAEYIAVFFTSFVITILSKYNENSKLLSCLSEICKAASSAFEETSFINEAIENFEDKSSSDYKEEK